jgi:hypothetical protein
MAMWITRERAQTGTVFGFKDKFEGLGIFIDTYKNGRTGVSFPYVMAMLGDGQTAYDNDNDGKANDIGGCSVLCSYAPADFRPAVFEKPVFQQEANWSIIKTTSSPWNYNTKTRKIGNHVSISPTSPSQM